MRQNLRKFIISFNIFNFQNNRFNTTKIFNGDNILFFFLELITKKNYY